MALLISTNMYKAEEFKRILSYVEKWKGQVGVEVFPMFHRQVFASLLEESMDVLKHVPISFHGPYYKAEHSAPQGTPEYEYTMELVGQTLRYSERLNSRYMVFHHNNCVVRDEERMLRDSCANYRSVQIYLQSKKSKKRNPGHSSDAAGTGRSLQIPRLRQTYIHQ